MILYYKEKNGDYLAIETTTNSYYQNNFKKDHFEGRATSLQGIVSSVCTTGISREFLKDCKKVAKKNVPQKWQNAIG